MKRSVFKFILSLVFFLPAAGLHAQETLEGLVSVYNTLSQSTPDAGQAIQFFDNNLTGDKRFLTFGRYGNKPYIRHLNADRMAFLNQNGTLVNAEIVDDGIIYPREGVIGKYFIEKAGYWDASTAADVAISGGDLYSNGPQSKTFNGGWRATVTGQHITFDLGESVSVAYITFGTFFALDPRFIPAGYTISYSNDNVSYAVFQTVTNNTDLNPLHNIQGTFGRYWRITVTGFQPSQTNASINGLKILSTQGASSNGNYWGSKVGTSDIAFTGGGVSIGTNKLPTGYRLAVNGAVISTKVKVSTYATWPDYVFDSSYQLSKLDKVEAFIRENKHLPGIPSANEVKKDGLDLAENQAALLKKIEELTLYLIEQNKKIEQMENEITTLKAKH